MVASIGHEDNMTCLKINDHGHVLVSLAHRELVDANVLQTPKPTALLRLEAPLEMVGQDRLDELPANAQVLSQSADRHVAAQFNNQTSERV